MYIAIGIAAALFAADRILKYLSRTGKLKWERRYVRLTHLENRGFFLGLGQKHEKLLRWLPLGDVPPDSRAAGEYYRAILSGHDCVALLRLCKTLHAKQNSQTASHRGVNSTELRSWRMAEEMLYGEFGFALGMPPAQVRDFLREKLGG